MEIIICISQFIDNSSILSGLLITVIISLSLIYIFRWPNLALDLGQIMQNDTNAGVLDFHLTNKKKFMAYNSNEVYFSFYIPVKMLSEIRNNNTRSTKQFFLITKDGHKPWDPLRNIRDRFSYEIEGIAYYIIRGVAGLDVFPMRKIHTLRIAGDFDRAEKHKIYYWFSTRHGIYPRYTKSRKWPFVKKYTGKLDDVLAGRLPFSIPVVREKE